jgi:hypothetical protein
MFKNIKPYTLPPRGKTIKKQVAVCQFDLNGKFIKLFQSIKEAADSLGRDGEPKAGISWACRVHRKAFGYQWRHASECKRK